MHLPAIRPDPTRASAALPIVVGAHVRAEVHDRPVAAAVLAALTLRASPEFPLAPVVVTDLWYLNSDALRAQPTLCIGHPDVNALSAYLADKLPSVLAIDGRLLVQMDPELSEPVACCWGIDPRATAEAAHAFLERWSMPFLQAAARAARR